MPGEARYPRLGDYLILDTTRPFHSSSRVMVQFFRFCGLCFYFAHKEAWRASFGYASPAGGAIVSGIGAAIFPSFMTNGSWVDTIARGALGGLAGWGVVFLLYLIFFAPKKALATLKPIVLKISDQISSPEMTQEHIEKHIVYISVKNLSPLKSIRCRIFIDEIPNVARAMPWQIHSCNIPREDEFIFQLADWFIWPGERETNKIRILAELGGGFAESAAIQLPQDGAYLKILVRTNGFPDIFAWCRVSVNQNEKRLVLKGSNGPDAH